MLAALLLSPPPTGVGLYSHVGGIGGGADGGGGAEGGWQVPSQSTMYSTYTKLPSYALLLTASVALVTNVYVPSELIGSGTSLAHSKKPLTRSFGAPSIGLHLPCTSSPLAVVLTTYSSILS